MGRKKKHIINKHYNKIKLKNESMTIDELSITELQKKVTVDKPRIGHPPSPHKPVVLRTCSVSGKEFVCMTARPSPRYPLTFRACLILGCPIYGLSSGFYRLEEERVE
jgi:hypothetical protein